MSSRITNYFETIIRLLKSEYTVDALRNAFAVIVPVVLFFNIGMPNMGIGISVGALMACMTDLPGNRSDKLRGTIYTILTFFVIAYSTSWISLHYPVLVIGLVVLIVFCCTMLGVFGQRMGAIGLMIIILATFTIGLKPQNALLYAWYIALGSIWYFFISMLQIYIFPYRSLKRAINKTQRLTTALLELRSEGYNPHKDLSGFNRRNIDLHLKLATQHELVRQLLLTDRLALSGSDKGARLLKVSISLIDLYEQTSAVHYDYPYIRSIFRDTDVLPLIERLILNTATSLKSHNNDLLKENNAISLQLLTIGEALPEATNAVLTQILININAIEQLVATTVDVDASTLLNDHPQVDYQDFINVKTQGWELFIKNLNFNSSIFRFSLRLTALCLIAAVLIHLLTEEHYSYWLLLTMVIVSRPFYSHTLRRNIERLVGTFFGIILAWLAVRYLGLSVQLFISGFGLFLFFVFNRPRYWLSVIAITITVIICLNSVQGNLWGLLSERAYFTIGGLVLCLIATFLFPIWNLPRIKYLLTDVVKANLDYFQAALKINPNQQASIHQQRLARKNSQQKLAILSEAIVTARQEPFKKSVNWELINKIELLTYQINVLIASYAGLQKDGVSSALTSLQVNQIVNNLQTSINNLMHFDIYSNVTINTYSGKPMELLETTNTLTAACRRQTS